VDELVLEQVPHQMLRSSIFHSANCSMLINHPITRLHTALLPTAQLQLNNEHKKRTAIVEVFGSNISAS
jgi:hypothetical protein